MSLNNKSDSEKKQEIQSKIEAVSRKLTAEDRDQLMQVLEYDDFRARVASLSMEDIQTHSSFELLADLLMSDQELTDELYTALTDPLNRHGVHGRCCAYAPYREILSHAKKIPEIPSPDENIEKSTIELKLTIYRVHYILEYVASPAQKANLLAQELQHIDNALLCVMEDLHSIDPF